MIAQYFIALSGVVKVLADHIKSIDLLKRKRQRHETGQGKSK